MDSTITTIEQLKTNDTNANTNDNNPSTRTDAKTKSQKPDLKAASTRNVTDYLFDVEISYTSLHLYFNIVAVQVLLLAVP